MNKNNRALVLSGGGARGAYQVGVLKGLSQICKEKNISDPFQIYSGISAGAINVAYLASHADNFHYGVEKLVDLWGQLRSEQVIATDMLRMGRIAARWLGELSLGALVGSTPGRALLDTAPLGKLLRDHLDFSSIPTHIQNGALRALAITATDYSTSNSVTFVQGHEDIKDWQRLRRRSQKTIISHEHIMASSAIPLLFPPVSLGNRFYGDGCVRNNSPCAPSIYLGADNLFVIGVRHQTPTPNTSSAATPSVAKIVNVLLNAVLLDGIEMDVEHLHRMNKLLKAHEGEYKASYRTVDAQLISPSQDIGRMALQKEKKLPGVLRYLLKGLGRVEDASEIISYLLFDSSFCTELMSLGYQDAISHREQIETFFSKE